jgi:multidrug resistance efflux pump
LYSYVILFAVVRFVYNIFSPSNPQWGFLPALLLAFLILRARLRSSERFVKEFYLDKQKSVRMWWNAPYNYKAVAAGLVVALVLFAPVWRETVGGRFMLEPEHSSVIRATEPGHITEVLTDEGTPVAAGTPLFVLRNAQLESEADHAQVGLRSAAAKAREAEMTYTDLGTARAEQISQAEDARSVFERVSALQVRSPISGVVATPRLRDRVGSFVQAGDVLAEVDDDRTLKARIFIPEFQVQRIRPGAPASLKLASIFQPIRGQVSSLAPASAELPSGLVEVEKYKGIAPPSYYMATVLVGNAGRMLRSGMSGDAKIYVKRKSVAEFVWETLRQFFQRKVW